MVSHESTYSSAMGLSRVLRSCTTLAKDSPCVRTPLTETRTDPTHGLRATLALPTVLPVPVDLADSSEVFVWCRGYAFTHLFFAVQGNWPSTHACLTRQRTVPAPSSNFDEPCAFESLYVFKQIIVLRLLYMGGGDHSYTVRFPMRKKVRAKVLNAAYSRERSLVRN